MKLTKNNLSGYHAGVSIRKALNENLMFFRGTLLDVGCGHTPYKELLLSNGKIDKYIGLDLADNQNYDNSPDMVWDGTRIPLDDESIDTVIVTEVFEHVPILDVVLKEIYRVLKKDGVLFFTVPFLWPLHDIPFDEYRYTPYSLRRHFQVYNFSSVEIFSLGGWDASLAQMLGLWVNLRPMNRFKRNILQIIFLPIVKFLLKKDRPVHSFDKNHLFYTGLYGLVRK